MTLFSFHVNTKSRSSSPEEIEFRECCDVDNFPYSAQTSSGPSAQSPGPEAVTRNETSIRTEVTSFFDKIVSPVTTEGEENEGSRKEKETEES